MVLARRRRDLDGCAYCPRSLTQALGRQQGGERVGAQPEGLLVTRVHRGFGTVVLLDCHSMPSTASSRDDRPRADFVLGDRYGTSCSPGITDVVEATLTDLGYTEEQVKAFAAEYEVEDGPNDDGEMFTRKAVPADRFPSPFPNEQAAAAANGGAAPPDFSLIAKARGVERGFPNFVFDVFTQYAENGPDYIHALLTGYEETPPEGLEVAEGTHYNPFFIGGASLAMAQPISDDQVTYDDGAPQTVDQYAKDVSAFLMWAAEPHLEQRKATGFRVMVFLILFAGLVYVVKRKIWSNVEH